MWSPGGDLNKAPTLTAACFMAMECCAIFRRSGSHGSVLSGLSAYSALLAPTLFGLGESEARLNRVASSGTSRVKASEQTRPSENVACNSSKTYPEAQYNLQAP